jgi:rod shape determining protein RodA
MSTEMNLFRRVDFWFYISWFSLLSIGILLVYSASAGEAEHVWQSHWFKQLIYLCVGMVLCGFCALTPLRVWRSICWPMYLISLGLLVFVAFGGGTLSHGADRWISIGGFRFQPSELAKIAYLLTLADVLQNRVLTLKDWRPYVKPLILFIIPFILILKQPNLSTALSFSVMTLVGFYWAGLRIRDLFLLLSPIVSVVTSVFPTMWYGFGAVLLAMIWRSGLSAKWSGFLVVVNLLAGYASYFVWSHLHDHQRSRIMTFLDPMRDPRGEGYQVLQSQVAIGSGGVWGKGWLQGSQTNLDFLPEEHTDFIFSVLAEQFGLVGCTVVLLLFWVLLFRMLRQTVLRKNEYGNFLVVGVVSVFSFHILVNIAMTMGMMPVTGLPLPFISYGGTFLIACMIMMGLVLSVRYHEKNDV